jgi:putative MATE family efflux protein
MPSVLSTHRRNSHEKTQMPAAVEAAKYRERGSALERDWTKGSVTRNLLSLSWPMVVMESLWVVSQITDLIWVGRLGSRSIAGVGIANAVLAMVYSVDMGMIVGVRAMIARCVGAGDTDGANHVTGQAILLGSVWGLLVTTLGAFLAAPMLRVLGTDPAVVDEGAAYLRLMLVGWVGFEVLVMGLYAIQASGDAITPMLIEGAMRTVHVALCPFLVLGLWVFPHFGVRGAALANVIGQSLGALILLLVLFTGYSRLHLRLQDFRLAPRTLWRLLRVGIPAVGMNLQGSLGGIFLMGLVVPFGTMAVAAHSLASRVEMFLSVPGVGLGTGAGVLVGHNLGAGQPKRAVKTAWLALGFVQAFMLACCVVILFWVERIIGVFTSDPGVIALGSTLLRISTAGYLVTALSYVLQNCIAGAGDTVPNMVISIGVIWVVQLPLAFVLPRLANLGIYGVRWAMAANLIVAAIASLIYFTTGRWKTKRI